MAKRTSGRKRTTKAEMRAINLAYQAKQQAKAQELREAGVTEWIEDEN